MSEPANWFVGCGGAQIKVFTRFKKALAAEHISREDYY